MAVANILAYYDTTITAVKVL